MSNPTSELTFPLALRNGSLVRPSEVERGDRSLRCLGCDEPMIVHQGPVVVWHFAHKSDQDGSCSGEGALHNATKLAIKERFDKAKQENDLLLVVWPCENCGESGGNIHNIVHLADKVEMEKEIRYKKRFRIGVGQKRIRPDLVFMEDGKPRFALEVVVTNWPAEQTLGALDKMRLKVFYFVPTWDWLEEFLSIAAEKETALLELDGLSRSVRSNNECPNRSCREVTSARKMVDEAMKIKGRFTPWSTSASVLEQAQVLAKLGFIQDDEHLGLFVLHLDAKPFLGFIQSAASEYDTRPPCGPTPVTKAIWDEQRKVLEQDWAVYADFIDNLPVNIYSKTEYWNRSTGERLKYQGEMWHRIENTILSQVARQLNSNNVKFKRLFTQPWGYRFVDSQTVPRE